MGTVTVRLMEGVARLTDGDRSQKAHPWAIILAAASAERWLDFAERRELGKSLAEVRKGGGDDRDEGFEMYLAWIQPDASPSSSEEP